MRATRPVSRAFAIRSVNPHDGSVLKEYPVGNASHALEKLDHAHTAFSSVFSGTSVAARVEMVRSLARILRDRRDEYARLITMEMGKPLKQAVGEVDKCAALAEWYADNGPRFLEDKPVPTDASKSYVAYRPLGVIFQFAPFNFPFWQVIRFAVPALLAANTVLIRHSHGTPQSAEALETLFAAAGFPSGVLQALFVDHDAAWAVVDDPRVRGVTVTGSTEVGGMAAARAGRGIKKSVLELGGNDAFVVCADADLDTAVDNAVIGRTINNGQSCIAAKRFIVHEAVADEFVERFAGRFGALRVGNPLEEATEIGPLARTDLRDKLAREVEEGLAHGAEAVVGGGVPAGPGAYFPPTVLDRVSPANPIFHRELFGPVASVIRVGSDEEAVQVANMSSYGLGGAVFSKNVAKAEALAARLDCGMAFVNTFTRSDPRLPFGGVKESGYGRECAEEGVKEWVNVKTMFIK